MVDVTGLPGAERVERGLADLAAGHRSEESLWLTIAARRLRESGLPIPGEDALEPEPELQLYAVLGEQRGDTYSRYNALCRELDSFLAALDGRLRSVRR